MDPKDMKIKALEARLHKIREALGSIIDIAEIGLDTPAFQRSSLAGARAIALLAAQISE